MRIKHKLLLVTYLLLVSLVLASFSSLVMAQNKLPKLVLAGPFSSVANPLVHMVESGALDDLGR